MKQRRTSLKDLADQLGVSIATVSRALRNSHEVGEEMTQKVKSLAKELNYRPNPFAQSLRKEAPRVIGVIVPNLVTHYYAAVLDGIEDYAVRNGYSVISANSHENTEHEKRAVENFLNMHVEGIIACLAQDTVDYSHFEQLHKMGVPLVFFARCCLEDKFSQVVGNGDVAAQEATQHMIPVRAASPSSAVQTILIWCAAENTVIWRRSERTAFLSTATSWFATESISMWLETLPSVSSKRRTDLMPSSPLTT